MNKLRTVSVAAALLVAGVPSPPRRLRLGPSVSMAASAAVGATAVGALGAAAVGAAAVGVVPGSASGLPQAHSLVPHSPPPITAMATVIPTAMVTITPTVIQTAMVTITPRVIAPPISPRLTPPPMRRRLTETTATEILFATTAMVFVTRATAMVFVTRATAMVFATRATAPLTWDDQSGLAGTGADMLGRDMDVALGKPVLLTAPPSKRVLAGTERTPKS